MLTLGLLIALQTARGLLLLLRADVGTGIHPSLALSHLLGFTLGLFPGLGLYLSSPAWLLPRTQGAPYLTSPDNCVADSM